jgi:hypothetical protein
MLKDAQDLSVTTNSPQVISLIDQFQAQLLGYGNQLDIILEPSPKDDHAPLLNAYRGAFYLLAETQTGMRQARDYLTLAETGFSAANQREQWVIRGIAAWWAGSYQDAVNYFWAIASHYPRDIIAVNLAQYLYLFRVGGSKKLLPLIQLIFPANQ